MAPFSYARTNNLLDGDFGAADAAAAERAEGAARHLDDAVTCSMDGEVAAHRGACAGALGHADLTNDNLAGLDCLATEKFDAEALAD